jgi:two-component sensor histidine kinase
MKSRVKNSAFRVAGIYAAISFAWIAFSDSVATWIAKDYANLASFQTVKGFFFVAATTALLYFFSKRQFERIIAVSSEREQAARAALREKETLLREINHRVKNNLQVILGLLRLHSTYDQEFIELEGKIKSMALAHDMLTSAPDMSSIEAGRFAASLAETLQNQLSMSAVELRGSGDATTISSDVAVSTGILIAEACSNAAKYGRRASEAVSIAIDIRTDGESVVATVRDDGPGFPESVVHGEAGSERGLGISMMEALAEQARGRLTLSNDSGAVVELRMPVVR